MSGEDEVVEPEQGNGRRSCPRMLRSCPCARADQASPLAYHLAVAPRCRPESGRAAHLYSRAEVHAGAHHQVRPKLSAPRGCGGLTG